MSISDLPPFGVQVEKPGSGLDPVVVHFHGEGVPRVGEHVNLRDFARDVAGDPYLFGDVLSVTWFRHGYVRVVLR